jgi:hypothetical protein
MDGWNAHEIMQRLNQGGFKHAQELVDTLMLGCLEKFYMALLTIAHIPYRDSICHDWDDKGIIYFPPSRLQSCCGEQWCTEVRQGRIMIMTFVVSVPKRD